MNSSLQLHLSVLALEAHAVKRSHQDQAIPYCNRSGDKAEAYALLKLIDRGRREISQGDVIPAGHVFAQFEAMDKDAEE